MRLPNRTGGSSSRPAGSRCGPQSWQTNQVRRYLLILIAIFAEASADATSEPGWDLQVPAHVEVTAGTTGTLPIGIVVGPGKTISRDADITLDVSPEPGIAIKRRRLRRGDSIDPNGESPRFAIPFSAPRPGDYAIKVHMQFWVCGTKICRPIDARRTVVVSATTGVTK